jgi:hypothetical protein
MRTIRLPFLDDLCHQSDQSFLGNAERAGPTFNRVITTTNFMLGVGHSICLIDETQPQPN